MKVKPIKVEVKRQKTCSRLPLKTVVMTIEDMRKMWPKLKDKTE